MYFGVDIPRSLKYKAVVPSNEKSIRFTIQIPVALHRKLRKEAKEEGLSVVQVVRAWLHRYERQERR